MDALYLLLDLATGYLVIGLTVWAFITMNGGFMMPDGKTPAPFWRCMLMTTLMWPAALKNVEIL